MIFNVRLIARVFILCLFFFCGNASADTLPTSQSVTEQHPLVFGFLPILSSERLVTRFAPLVDYLSQRSHLDIRMETAPDFPAFIQRTQQGQRYDLLFTAPHFFYLAEHDSGYRALVRVASPGMNAVVVVPINSNIQTLSDLRGRLLATTGPLALSTLLTRDLLIRSGLDPDKEMHLVSTPSHIAALLSSQQGTTHASAVMLPVFSHVRPEIRDSMRIVAETSMAPHIPIGIASRVPESIRLRLQAILLAMPDDPDGRAVLQHLDWPGFALVADHEYDSVRWLAEQVKVE
jgi:phosphonate transport system substrate-binding protein